MTDEHRRPDRAAHFRSTLDLLSQRAAFEVTELAFRMTDGDQEIGRVMRDTRLGPIGGGSDEVMKEILAKQVGL